MCIFSSSKLRVSIRHLYYVYLFVIYATRIHSSSILRVFIRHVYYVYLLVIYTTYIHSSFLLREFICLLYYVYLFFTYQYSHTRLTMISHHHHHLSLHRECRWDTTDDFTTSFLHFSLFSTAVWDLENSRPVHSLMLSSHLSLRLPCLLPPFTVPCKMVLATAVCVSLRSSRGLRVFQLPAGSWHGLPCW